MKCRDLRLAFFFVVLVVDGCSRSRSKSDGAVDSNSSLTDSWSLPDLRTRNDDARATGGAQEVGELSDLRTDIGSGGFASSGGTTGSGGAIQTGGAASGGGGVGTGGIGQAGGVTGGGGAIQPADASAAPATGGAMQGGTGGTATSGSTLRGLAGANSAGATGGFGTGGNSGGSPDAPIVDTSCIGTGATVDTFAAGLDAEDSQYDGEIEVTDSDRDAPAEGDTVLDTEPDEPAVADASPPDADVNDSDAVDSGLSKIGCLYYGSYSISANARAYGLSRASLPTGGPPCTPFNATAPATVTIQAASGALRTISIDPPPATLAMIQASWSPALILSWPGWTITSNTPDRLTATGGIVCGTGPPWTSSLFTLDLDCTTGLLSLSGSCTADWPSGCSPDYVYQASGQTTLGCNVLDPSPSGCLATDSEDGGGI